MAGNTTDIVLVAQAEVAPAANATTETTVATEHEAPTVFPPFDASSFASQLLWFAITFGALYIVMSRVALPRIGSIIDTRRAKIEGDLAEAERLRVETEKALADYEAALAAARQKAHAMAEETRSGIKADLDAKRTKVEADLTKKVTTAEAGIQKTKTAALANVDEIAAETAMALVSQLVGTVTAKDAREAVAAVVKG
jgi:F-type H+-transporting ATPase subunit b